MTREGIGTGVPIDGGEPLFGVRDDRFQHDSITFFANAHFVALEAKFLRQAHGLAVTVAKELSGLGHG